MMPMDNREAAAVSRAWIEAGSLLARDRSARIVCPSCGRGVLIVSDEPTPDGTHVERWMRCNACGNANTILLTLGQGSGAVGEKASGQSADGGFDWTDKRAVEDLVKRAVKSLRK
jgi:hypothetical protein